MSLTRYRAVILVPRELYCHASDIDAAKKMFEEMAALVFAKHKINAMTTKTGYTDHVMRGIEAVDD